MDRQDTKYKFISTRFFHSVTCLLFILTILFFKTPVAHAEVFCHTLTAYDLSDTDESGNPKEPTTCILKNCDELTLQELEYIEQQSQIEIPKIENNLIQYIEDINGKYKFVAQTDGQYIINEITGVFTYTEESPMENEIRYSVDIEEIIRDNGLRFCESSLSKCYNFEQEKLQYLTACNASINNCHCYLHQKDFDSTYVYYEDLNNRNRVSGFPSCTTDVSNIVAKPLGYKTAYLTKFFNASRQDDILIDGRGNPVSYKKLNLETIPDREITESDIVTIEINFNNFTTEEEVYNLALSITGIDNQCNYRFTSAQCPDNQIATNTLGQCYVNCNYEYTTTPSECFSVLETPSTVPLELGTEKYIAPYPLVFSAPRHALKVTDLLNITEDKQDHLFYGGDTVWDFGSDKCSGKNAFEVDDRLLGDETVNALYDCETETNGACVAGCIAASALAGFIVAPGCFALCESPTYCWYDYNDLYNNFHTYEHVSIPSPQELKDEYWGHFVNTDATISIEHIITGEKLCYPKDFDESTDNGRTEASVCTLGNNTCTRPFYDAAYFGNVQIEYGENHNDTEITLNACTRRANTYSLATCGERSVYNYAGKAWNEKDVFKVRQGTDNCVDLKAGPSYECSLSYNDSETSTLAKDQLQCAKELAFNNGEKGDDREETTYRLRSINYGDKVCVFLDEKDCPAQTTIDANPIHTDCKFYEGHYGDNKSLECENAPYNKFMDVKNSHFVKEEWQDDGDRIREYTNGEDNFTYTQTGDFVEVSTPDSNIWQSWMVVQYTGDNRSGFFTNDNQYIPNQQCYNLPLGLEPPRFYKMATIVNSPDSFFPILGIHNTDLDRIVDFYTPDLTSIYGSLNKKLTLLPEQKETEINVLTAVGFEHLEEENRPTATFKTIKDFGYAGPVYCLEQKLYVAGEESWETVGCIERENPQLSDIKMTLVNDTYNNPKIKVVFDTIADNVNINTAFKSQDSDILSIGEVATNDEQAYDITIDYSDKICYKVFTECLDYQFDLNKLIAENDSNNIDAIIELKDKISTCATNIRPLCALKGGMDNDLNTINDLSAYGLHHEICLTKGFDHELKYVKQLIPETLLGGQPITGKCVLTNTSKQNPECQVQNIDFSACDYNNEQNLPDYCKCNSGEYDALDMPDLCFTGGYNPFNIIEGDNRSCACQTYDTKPSGLEYRKQTLREAGLCIDITQAETCTEIDYGTNTENPSDPKWAVSDEGSFSISKTHTMRTRGSETETGNIIYPVVGHAEFPVALATNDVNYQVTGECNGFWTYDKDEFGAIKLPKAQCNPATKKFDLVSNSCIRNSCKSIQTQEPRRSSQDDTIAKNYKIVGDDLGYYIMGSGYQSKYEYASDPEDTTIRLKDSDNRGVEHGYAMWNRETMPSTVDGDYPALFQAAGCITGFGPEGLSNAIYNYIYSDSSYINDTIYNQNPQNLASSIDALGSFDTNLPYRYCSQLGNWMALSLTPSNKNNTCQRLNCPALNEVEISHNNNVNTDPWKQTSGAIWNEKPAYRISLPNINMLNDYAMNLGNSTTPYAVGLNFTEELHGQGYFENDFYNAIAQGSCDMSKGYYNSDAAFQSTFLTQKDAYNYYISNNNLPEGYELAIEKDTVLVNSNDSSNLTDVLLYNYGTNQNPIFKKGNLKPLRVCNQWGIWGPVEQDCVKACPMLEEINTFNGNDTYSIYLKRNNETCVEGEITKDGKTYCQVSSAGAFWKKSLSNEGVIKGSCYSDQDGHTYIRKSQWQNGECVTTEPTRTCGVDGNWGEVTDGCIEKISCGYSDATTNEADGYNATTVWNAGDVSDCDIYDDNGSSKAIVSGLCKPGYRPQRSDNKLERTCNFSTGEWEAPAEDMVCVPITCSPIDTITQNISVQAPGGALITRDLTIHNLPKGKKIYICYADWHKQSSGGFTFAHTSGYFYNNPDSGVIEYYITENNETDGDICNWTIDGGEIFFDPPKDPSDNDLYIFDDKPHACDRPITDPSCTPDNADLETRNYFYRRISPDYYEALPGDVIEITSCASDSVNASFETALYYSNSNTFAQYTEYMPRYQCSAPEPGEVTYETKGTWREQIYNGIEWMDAEELGRYTQCIPKRCDPLSLDLETSEVITKYSDDGIAFNNYTSGLIEHNGKIQVSCTNNQKLYKDKDNVLDYRQYTCNRGAWILDEGFLSPNETQCSKVCLVEKSQSGNGWEDVGKYYKSGQTLYGNCESGYAKKFRDRPTVYCSDNGWTNFDTCIKDCVAGSKHGLSYPSLSVGETFQICEVDYYGGCWLCDDGHNLTTRVYKCNTNSQIEMISSQYRHVDNNDIVWCPRMDQKGDWWTSGGKDVGVKADKDASYFLSWDAISWEREDIEITDLNSKNFEMNNNIFNYYKINTYACPFFTQFTHCNDTNWWITWTINTPGNKLLQYGESYDTGYTGCNITYECVNNQNNTVIPYEYNYINHYPK